LTQNKVFKPTESEIKFNVSIESDDEFEDNRLQIGQKLKIPTIPENKKSFLSRFLFFEVVKIDNHSTSNLENAPRSISKEGLFEDSGVQVQGKLDQSQRITFESGKFILTIYALSPHAFPVHNLEFKLTSPEDLRVKHLVDQRVVDFVGNYAPNKYFSLFQDKLMFLEDFATMSFHLKLFEKKPKEIRNSTNEPESKESNKSESKKRKKETKESRSDNKKTDFNLNEYQILSEDLHVIFEIHCRDKLLYRFGGRKSVMTSPFKLSRKGYEVSDSLSKTLNENVKDNKKQIAPLKSETVNLIEGDLDELKGMEVMMDLPSRFRDIEKKPEKKKMNMENLKGSEATKNRVWSMGEWTIKAYLDPRENPENYIDQKKNLKTNLFKPFILDPEQIKYFDLNDKTRLQNETKIHQEQLSKFTQNPKKSPKGKQTRQI
jgi:hypothetical protein